MKTPCQIVNVNPADLFFDDEENLRPLPAAPHFVTAKKVVGDDKFGFGQSAVKINDSVWINELYVKPTP